MSALSQNPLGYTGVLAKNPPDFIRANRAPTAADRQHPVGTLWEDFLTRTSYQLVSVAGGVAVWNILASFATNSVARAGTSTTASITPANLTALKEYTDITFRENPVLQSALTTGAAPSGATGDLNIMMMEGGICMQQFILGAGQTIIAPRMSTAGLLISLDLTNNEGAEYNFGVNAINRHAFTIGTSAPFFFECRLTVADVSGADPVYIGFRRNVANNADYTTYSDYAFLGLNATAGANIWTETVLNGGAAVQTDTTNTWVDGGTHTLRVSVGATGVVSYLIDGAAPTVSAAFTFDNGDVVIPCIHFLHGAAAPGAINLVSMKCGLQ